MKVYSFEIKGEFYLQVGTQSYKEAEIKNRQISIRYQARYGSFSQIFIISGAMTRTNKHGIYIIVPAINQEIFIYFRDIDTLVV